jgi:phosphoglycolate phosphatase
MNSLKLQAFAGGVLAQARETAKRRLSWRRPISLQMGRRHSTAHPASRSCSKKTVIFDLDGTLVDTAPDLWRATNHVLTAAGRSEVSLDQLRAFVGHGARKLIARGFEATGSPLRPQDIEPLYQKFVAYYGANIARESTPFSGCVLLLDRLKAEGVLLGICTNKLEGLSVKLIGALGLTKYFAAIVGPDTIGIAKPDPAPYREALRRMGAEMARSLLVGDSETDVLTARAAGVPVIGVTFGYTAEPIESFKPDVLVKNFSEAYGAIVAALDS